MILTDVGEVGVHVGERVHILRPSLYAMSQLGEPREIVELFAAVMGEAPSLVDALAVVLACSDEDLSDLFGCVLAEGEKLTYEPGHVEAEAVVLLARCLLKHGITGSLPELPRPADQEPEYVQEFDARAHVSMAMAHLGVSERDAWQMTMTGLVGALRAKFPPSQNDSPGAKAPSKAEMEEALAWHDRVLLRQSSRHN
ncbi:glycoprotein [Alcaligenes faecalis]|uniref:Glycoprotein n=2 Tax=Alcaligenes faecalis TaxID=511 RepID=A0AB33D075_ALCFA|nr:glycoprotein [Alcaligenes faecalis]